MKLILLSGGSGQRLWPLSNDVRAKQFLKVLQNDAGEYESMVQRVWTQLAEVGATDHTVIATGKGQVDLLHSQLGSDVRLVIEPSRRDTFPAIALAATYLYSELEVREDEIVGVLAVDPFVEPTFFQKVLELESLLKETSKNLGVIGVKPTYPSAKYGYIIPSNIISSYFDVSHFIEKPIEQEAEQLIEQGALWNAGVFAFKLKYILDLLRQRNLPLVYKELVKEYDKLPKISFDYEVVEKEKNIVALPYEGYWKDLGTWNTLTEEMDDNIFGNGVQSKDCHNTHIVNELDIPVKALGVSNLVIAVSSDGILVTDKSQSSRMKEILGKEKNRPMYEERRWGWYRVLDYTNSQDGNEVLTKRLCIRAGENLSYQLHQYRSEIWTIISGSGEFILDGNLMRVKPGDVLQIPIGAKHAIRAVEDLELIEVQMGSKLIEEDIVRIEMEWNKILNTNNENLL